MRFRTIWLAAIVACWCVCGCSHREPRHVTQQQDSSTTAIIASSTEKADADFKSHNWDYAITEYSQAIETGLPNGSVNMRGTNSYVKHQISLCHLYKGLAAKEIADYETSKIEFHKSIAIDPSNTQAKKLLNEVKHESAVHETSDLEDAVSTNNASLLSRNSCVDNDNLQIRSAIKQYKLEIADSYRKSGEEVPVSDKTERLEISQTSSTEAIADVYTQGQFLIRMHIRKFDTGWKVESVEHP